MSKPTRSCRRKPSPVHFAEDLSYAYQEANLGFVIKVSPEDADLLAAYVWTVSKANEGSHGVRYYVKRRVREGGKYRTVYLHREITGAVGTAMVDHENADGTDNRRSNLRPGITHVENSGNRRKTRLATASRFKGVSCTRSGKWRAQIKVDGQFGHLGTFACEIEAAQAYDRAALAAFGAFALINFPLERSAA